MIASVQLLQPLVAPDALAVGRQTDHSEVEVIVVRLLVPVVDRPVEVTIVDVVVGIVDVAVEGNVGFVVDEFVYFVGVFVDCVAVFFSSVGMYVGILRSFVHLWYVDLLEVPGLWYCSVANRFLG